MAEINILKIEGTTPQGFEYAISADRINDWEYVEKLAELDRSENEVQAMRASIDLARYVLGKVGYFALVENIRKKNGGKAPVKIVTDEIRYILSNGEAKKS